MKCSHCECEVFEPLEDYPELCQCGHKQSEHTVISVQEGTNDDKRMPDISNRKQYEQYQADVAAFIARESLSFLSTGCSDSTDSDEYEHECEPWFSWHPCECCGSHLGGDREYLFARDKEDKIVRFTICEDCVYYVNYGRLDDTTMQRIETA